MQLLAAGLNHHTAPVALRERIALSGSRLDDALERLRARVGSGFIISTCNRTECYAVVGHADSGTEVLLSLLREGTDVRAEELAPHADAHAHDGAVRHLFRVAAGLDSMVPGEDQIVAQLKGALARATAVGTLDPMLHRLGTAALAAGKRVRTETGLARHPLSVVSVALQLAAERLGTLAGQRILIVGAGETAALALKHLAGSDAGSITLVNRTPVRGAALAAAYGVPRLDWGELGDAVTGADLVLSCTSAPGIVLGADALERATVSRGGTAVLVFDLAVPRDVDPAAGEIPGVQLWDIDGLQAICDENRARRSREIERAEAIVDRDAERFMAWWSARQVAPTIAALLAHADTIREREVARTLARMPSLSEREEELLRTLATRVVSKLLHTPLTRLKTDPEGANMARVVQHLFALDVEAGAPAVKEGADPGPTSPGALSCTSSAG